MKLLSSVRCLIISLKVVWSMIEIKGGTFLSC
jgi:hypothetical protein